MWLFRAGLTEGPLIGLIPAFGPGILGRANGFSEFLFFSGVF